MSNTDESFPASMPVAEVPVYIARAKASAVRTLVNNSGQIIIAADTVVVLGNTIIGKPTDRADAIAILRSLSGQQHEVITGVVIRKGEKEIAFADRTVVWFHSLTDAQIEFYVDNYKPYDKAGAYAIQEWIGVVGIRSVEGDFYNVMGLPVSRVVRALAEV